MNSKRRQGKVVTQSSRIMNTFIKRRKAWKKSFRETFANMCVNEISIFLIII